VELAPIGGGGTRPDAEAVFSQGIPDAVQKTGGDDGGKCDQHSGDQVTQHLAGKMAERPRKHLHEPALPGPPGTRHHALPIGPTQGRIRKRIRTDKRLNAAIVPASSRRGIAVSEALARGTSGSEFTPDPLESRCVGLDVNVERNSWNVVVLLAFSFCQTITEITDANSSFLCRGSRNGGFRPSFRASKR